MECIFPSTSHNVSLPWGGSGGNLSKEVIFIRKFLHQVTSFPLPTRHRQNDIGRQDCLRAHVPLHFTGFPDCLIDKFLRYLIIPWSKSFKPKCIIHEQKSEMITNHGREMFFRLLQPTSKWPLPSINKNVGILRPFKSSKFSVTETVPLQQNVCEYLIMMHRVLPFRQNLKCLSNNLNHLSYPIANRQWNNSKICSIVKRDFQVSKTVYEKATKRTLPTLLYIHNPLSWLLNKIDFKMLRATWDANFDENEFKRGAKQVSW